MQKRVAAIPNDSESEMEKKISPTHEEAAKSFERNDSKTQKDQKKEASKRPLSDSSNTPPSIQPQKKTNFATEKDLSELFEPDSEINSSSSTEDQDLKLLTDPCCYELIQKCTGRYFVCACERQYYKYKSGRKTIGREKGAYKCDNCR